MCNNLALRGNRINAKCLEVFKTTFTSRIHKKCWITWKCRPKIILHFGLWWRPVCQNLSKLSNDVDITNGVSYWYNRKKLFLWLIATEKTGENQREYYFHLVFRGINSILLLKNICSWRNGKIARRSKDEKHRKKYIYFTLCMLVNLMLYQTLFFN